MLGEGGLVESGICEGGEDVGENFCEMVLGERSREVSLV